MGPSGRFTHVMIYWTVWDRFIHVLYLGRAPSTKETLPDFFEVASGNPTSTCIPRVDG